MRFQFCSEQCGERSLGASIFLAREEAKGIGVLQATVAARVHLWSKVASVLVVVFVVELNSWQES